ncbi:UDP-N-acetylmuramate dehydrogenase [Winogradskyella maritima]|uniref:UDP-N-acetylenolpyruvoylglucosamine reductase n=1 Tax=Winogradskyella maritima TaxID=1517766 RepID=A0ABV8AJY1_9FLAO|nr:UDP-N-acetylmuramate dehydrogenase [Winogradskyella maritima]
MATQTDISLQPYNTFGLDVKAQNYVNIKSIEQLKDALAQYAQSDIFVLGGGSNLLLTKSIQTPVFHINLKGISVVSETEEDIILKVMAGENWHEFVLFCLERNYGGIENLSLIPGNVGTAPMQNIGAYGIEIKDVFESCSAMHIKSQREEQFSKEYCQFGYRESIFKNSHKGQYIITSVEFKLTKKNHTLRTDYGAIKDELLAMNVSTPSIQDISKAVIAIRQRKLPDPKDIGNSGSFFKNPVISSNLFEDLKRQFPDIPNYVVSDSEIKVPAGWLIEKAGFKGKTFGNYGVHENQALVLVNYGGADGKDILNLAKLIQNTVVRLFNIQLQMEVNII